MGRGIHATASDAGVWVVYVVAGVGAKRLYAGDGWSCAVADARNGGGGPHARRSVWGEGRRGPTGKPIDWGRRLGGRGLRVLLRSARRPLRSCGLRLRMIIRSRTSFITRIEI